MAVAREECDNRLAELARRAGTSAFDSAPAACDGASFIAFRDAQDRAERLEHRDEAEATMRRSLEAGDRTMVKAIARRAHTRVGVDVDLLREVGRLEQLSSPQGRRRDQRRLFRWSV
jgi:hypothetical protein